MFHITYFTGELKLNCCRNLTTQSEHIRPLREMNATSLQYLRSRIETSVSKSCAKENECWIFTGARNNGYGMITVQKSSLYPKKSEYVHRISWIARHGRLPHTGMHISHTCGRRACFNPDHLEEKTATENQRDKLEQGTNNGRKSKLTAEQRDELYAAYDDARKQNLARGWRATLLDQFSGRFGVTITPSNLTDLVRVKNNGPRKREKSTKVDATVDDVRRAFVNALRKSTFETVRMPDGKTDVTCLVANYRQKRKYVIVTMRGQSSPYLHQVAAAVWHNNSVFYPSHVDEKKHEIDHVCQNPRCIAPHHLEYVRAGTNQQRVHRPVYEQLAARPQPRLLQCPLCTFSVDDDVLAFANHVSAEHVSAMPRSGTKRTRSGEPIQSN